MTSTEASPQIKRVCLQKEELELLSKDDIIEQWVLQDKYINSLELKSGEVENSELVSLRESEEKLKQQQLEATRRENILVMRLTTKEQEMQEYASQIQELKQSQVPTVAQLRAALLDPAVNLVFERMRKEVDGLKARLEETQNELSAWKFTPDSNTGKRLMAKCRSLYQENEELGKMISAGRLAKLEGDLALQRNFSEEMKKSQTELDEFLQELDEDVEGMQSTIIYLQQKLREAKEQLKKLQAENDLLSNNSSTNFSEIKESNAKIMIPKVDSVNTIEATENNGNTDNITNHDPNRTNGDKSPYSLTINSPRTPTENFELPSTPEALEMETSRACDSPPPVVLRLNSPSTPPEVNTLEERTSMTLTHSASTPPELPSTPEPEASPDSSCIEKEIAANQPRKILPSTGLEKPALIHENGLKQGVICYGHQSVLVGSPPIDYKRETAAKVQQPDPIVDETTTRGVLNNVRNQHNAEVEKMEINDSVTNKIEPSESSLPLDLVKKSGEFLVNHNNPSPVSGVVVTSNIVTPIVSTPNSAEQIATNVIVRDGGNVATTLCTNEGISPVIVPPKIRLLAAVQNSDSTPPLASSPSPPLSPNPLPVSVSPERTKRTRPLSDEEENTNSTSDLIISSPKKRKLMAIESLNSTSPGNDAIDTPSSPTGDKNLSVDIDTEVQVAQTLACWAAASSKERTRPKSPDTDQRVTGLLGNGDAVDDSKRDEGQS